MILDISREELEEIIHCIKEIDSELIDVDGILIQKLENARLDDIKRERDSHV
jgi:hypothetical protein